MSTRKAMNTVDKEWNGLAPGSDEYATIGLFTDSEGHNRVSGRTDRTITINNGKGETTFTGLESET